MRRRDFLKLVTVSPLMGSLPSVETARAASMERAQPNIKLIWWDNRWWKAEGNIVRWTESLKPPKSIESMFLLSHTFVEWNVLPTLDTVADICEYKDGLMWAGRYGEIWRIERCRNPYVIGIPYVFRRIEPWIVL